MAYTIISQNNSTTTLSDGVNTITVPSRVNLTSGNFTIVEVNNNMATLEDGDGNVYRDIPCVATLAGEGGGGSSLPDQTGHSGEFLTTDGTDASWAAVDALPDQTGNSGKFLTTDGTSPSWAAVPSLPSQTGNSGKFLTTDGTDASWGSVLWNQASSSSQAFGNFLYGNTNYKNISTGSYSNILFIGGPTSPTNTAYWQPNYSQIYIGSGGRISGHSAICLGGSTIAKGTGSIAIGGFADVQANYAIQLNAAASSRSNTDAGTFKIGNNNGNFEMMSADGTIPTARLTKVNSTITLTAAGWSSNTQTVNVTGMTATGIVFPSPDPTDQSAYTSAGILCTAQAAGTLTFTCTSVPSADIDVNVVML